MDNTSGSDMDMSMTTTILPLSCNIESNKMQSKPDLFKSCASVARRLQVILAEDETASDSFTDLMYTNTSLRLSPSIMDYKNKSSLNLNNEITPESLKLFSNKINLLLTTVDNFNTDFSNLTNIGCAIQYSIFEDELFSNFLDLNKENRDHVSSIISELFKSLLKMINLLKNLQGICNEYNQLLVEFMLTKEEFESFKKSSKYLHSLSDFLCIESICCENETKLQEVNALLENALEKNKVFENIEEILRETSEILNIPTNLSACQLSKEIKDACSNIFKIFSWINNVDIHSSSRNGYDAFENPYHLLAIKDRQMIELKTKNNESLSFITDLSVELSDVKAENIKQRKVIETQKLNIQKLEQENIEKDSEIQRNRDFFYKLFKPQYATAFAEKVVSMCKKNKNTSSITVGSSTKESFVDAVLSSSLNHPIDQNDENTAHPNLTKNSASSPHQRYSQAQVLRRDDKASIESRKNVNSKQFVNVIQGDTSTEIKSENEFRKFTKSIPHINLQHQQNNHSPPSQTPKLNSAMRNPSSNFWSSCSLDTESHNELEGKNIIEKSANTLISSHVINNLSHHPRKQFYNLGSDNWTFNSAKSHSAASNDSTSGNILKHSAKRIVEDEAATRQNQFLPSLIPSSIKKPLQEVDANSTESKRFKMGKPVNTLASNNQPRSSQILSANFNEVSSSNKQSETDEPGCVSS